MAKKHISERELLISQINEDLQYAKGEKIDESWFDDLKANVSGGINGLKQGVKNTGRRIANVGRTVKQVGSNISQGARAAGNLAIGNKEAALQNVNNVKNATANNKSIDNTAKNAASSAKVASYSKSILNTVGAYIKAGGDVQELISAIQELAPNNQNQQSPSPEEEMGSQMTDNAIQNGAVMDSYNPYKNSSRQLKMLNSIQ